MPFFHQRGRNVHSFFMKYCFRPLCSFILGEVSKCSNHGAQVKNGAQKSTEDLFRFVWLFFLLFLNIYRLLDGDCERGWGWAPGRINEQWWVKWLPASKKTPYWQGHAQNPLSYSKGRCNQKLHGMTEFGSQQMWHRGKADHQDPCRLNHRASKFSQLQQELSALKHQYEVAGKVEWEWLLELWSMLAFDSRHIRSNVDNFPQQLCQCQGADSFSRV